MPKAFLAAMTLVLCGVATGSLDQGRLQAIALDRYGQPGLEPVSDWSRLIELARGQPVPQQLSRINEFFNGRTVFSNDVEVWQQPDYWATPLETLVRGRGDCEDFAIAKYVSLIALGVPLAKLRLIYVKAQIAGEGGNVSQAHMVLGYYADPNGEPYILDNLVSEIAPASSRRDLVPVFSFNSEGLWAGGVKAASDPTERLSRWRDLLARLRQDGFL